MWAFAILMFLMLIIELHIYVTIFFYKGAFLDATKVAMTMSMAQNNKPMKEGVRKIWDEIQKTYSCCGIEKPFGEDWKNKLDLQPNSAPDSCCKMGKLNGCGKEAIGTETLFKNGCITEFDTFFENTFLFTGRFGIALVVAQLLSVITGCCLAMKMGVKT